MNKWRRAAGKAIDEAIDKGKAEGLSGQELEDYARKHGYPFGKRAMHPYKIWCAEMRARFGGKIAGTPSTKLDAYNAWIAEIKAASAAPRSGFTLIELMAVIAIVSILIVLAGAALVQVTADMRLTTGAKIAMDQLVKAHALALSSGGSGVRLVPDQPKPLARLADGTLDPDQVLTYSRIVPLTQPTPYHSGLAAIHVDGWPDGFTPAYGRLVLEESPVDADGHRAEPTSWWWAVRVGDTLTILGRPYTVVGPMLLGPADGNPTCHVNWGPQGSTSPLVRPGSKDGEVVPVQWLYLADRLDDDRDGLTDEGWDGIDDDLDGYTDEDDEWEVERWQGAAAFGCVATQYEIKPRLVPAPAGGAVLPASVMIDATGWATSRARSRLPVDPYTGDVDLVFNMGGEADSPSIYGRPANRPLDEGYLHLWVSGVQDVASPPLATGEGRLVTLDLRTGKTTSGYADAADVGGTITNAEGEGR